MPLIHLDAFGASLGKFSGLNVMMPDHVDKPVPMLLLLHGLSDDETMWQRRGAVELTCDGAPVCIVMPDGHTNFYTDTDADAYFSYVAHDVPALVFDQFNVSRKREDHYIAGLSMGGYGALKIALSEPENWRRAFSFSGAVDFDYNQKAFRKNGLLFREEARERDDVRVLLARDLKNGAELPSLHLYCGTEDFLYQQNVEMVRFIRAAGVETEFIEDPGYGHEWRYWQMCLGRVMSAVFADRKG